MNNDDYDPGIPVEVGRPAPFVCAPVRWFALANSCAEPTAAKVAPLVWFLSSVTKQKSFSVSNIQAEKFSIDRKQKAAGLKALQRAGLISIDTSPGKSAFVSVLWSPGI
ncbi:hypothetical protein [Brevifollis gellanilyticus]|uniref:Uncharacterized protein n=1 Tax=Brevifollis gellanilyticus TaxID=748831 RepID=A0A512M2E7_9BACT|nr:hypothetical protein [Brevifollis gellanilyticus]GEP40914.1 hypothetical protein BGE01nite_02050 [Brevifollis gellanilyticus]